MAIENRRLNRQSSRFQRKTSAPTTPAPTPEPTAESPRPAPTTPVLPLLVPAPTPGLGCGQQLKQIYFHGFDLEDFPLATPVIKSACNMDIPLTATLDDVRELIRAHYAYIFPAIDTEFYIGTHKRAVHEGIRCMCVVDNPPIESLVQVVLVKHFTSSTYTHVIADTKTLTLTVLCVGESKIFSIGNVRWSDDIRDIREKITSLPEYSGIPVSSIQLYEGMILAETAPFMRRKV